MSKIKSNKYSQDRTTKVQSQKNSSTSKREQPRKDSKTKRVNYDNTRVQKFRKDMQAVSDVAKQVESDRRKPGANEIAWYNGNPELLKAAASIPVATIVGKPITEFADTTNTGLMAYSVPGIMAISWAPTIGTDIDAVNQSFNSQYSFLVHANSRNYSYDASDLGILELAGISVFQILASMIRAYGISKYYQETSMYLPNHVLKAMGFNPEDIRQNLANMWFTINNLIDQTRQIWVPTVMPVADRWIWMNSMIFKDAQGPSAQLYMYVQNRYWIYNETSSETGSYLDLLKDDADTPVHFTPAEKQYSWSSWVSAAQRMIDALVGSQDRGIIYGDILNAYGAERIRAMSAISADFRIEPEYNAEVLMQIENLVLSDCEPAYVYQSHTDLTKGTLIKQAWAQKTELKVAYDGKVHNLLNRAVLNFHFPEQPTPELVTIATRAMSLGLNDQAPTFNPKVPETPETAKGVCPATCGTEVYGRVKIYTIVTSASGAIALDETSFLQTFGVASNMNIVLVDSLSDVMAFDWHPFLYRVPNTFVFPKPGSGSDGILTGFDGIKPMAAHGDYDHYTIIDVNMLSRINRVCVYSLFGVPQMVQ